MKIAGFIKKWMLPLAMLTGASVYLIYHYLPGPVHHAGPVLSGIVGIMLQAVADAAGFASRSVT